MNIYEATPLDVVDLGYLWADSTKEVNVPNARWGPEEIVGRIVYLTPRLAGLIDKGRCATFIARDDDGRAVGYLSCEIDPTESLNAQQIYVCEDYRDDATVMGRLVVSAGEWAEARGITRIAVVTRPDNIRKFERMGMAVTNVRLAGDLAVALERYRA